MALKRVFQMDEDFQERMFAKQIAVMKGQAWNVVEALKTPDHGPLELTRRAKVCVWDDLVDVPVAVPMRVTSSEMRRSSTRRQSLDEADITGSAPTSRVPVDDLLGIASAPAEMPRSGRFDTASPPNESALSNDSSPNGSGVFGSAKLSPEPQSQSQPGRGYQGPARALNVYEPDRRQNQKHQRRYSYATPATRQHSNSIAQQLYGDISYGADDDDLEGDLGFAAAEGQMSHQRKVIVERLEAVKSRNPVFTWC